jgi:hypothetical protein
MPEPLPWRERYGTRYTANAALATVVLILAWVWFTAHVKPHVSTIIFGGFSVAALGLTTLAVLGVLFDKSDALARFVALLKSPKWTLPLLFLLPLIVFAFATTFTLYFVQADGTPEVRMSVIRGAKPASVQLTTAEKVKAVSYFFAFRPVTVRIDTVLPTGFEPSVLTLRRGIPLQLTVPNAFKAKDYHLVRLVPLYNLVYLRGRTEPDPQYVVRVFLPGAAPIERRGLTFNAIYLGARVDELRSQSKSARAAEAGLRDTLRSLDESMSENDIKAFLSAWLDTPEFIPTRELKPGETVRVVLEGPAGKTETAVKIAGAVNDAYLEGGGE